MVFDDKHNSLVEDTSQFLIGNQHASRFNMGNFMCPSVFVDLHLGFDKDGKLRGADKGILVNQVIKRIKELGAVSVRKMDGIQETMKFPLPKGLKL